MRSRTESTRAVWAGVVSFAIALGGPGCDRGRDCGAFMLGAAEGGVLEDGEVASHI
jgi:hypothetical protein